MSKKLASGCFAVRIAARELGTLSAKMVYYSLINSHLQYGIVFWGNSSQYLLDAIFILQKRAVRLLAKADYRAHCRPLFIQHRILTLTCLFILETVCLIHKNKSNIIPLPRQYDTRRKNNLLLPIPHSTLIKHSIIYESPKIYNHLSDNLKAIKSLALFKKTVKDLLIDKAYYDLQEFYNDRF